MADISRLLEKAKKSKTGALNESDSRALLKAYGVPVVDERMVQNPADAVKAAAELGFPVVLKGTGATLLHKTERGLVHLNLNDADAVEKAAEAVIKEAGTELDGILVQPLLKARRELVAGMFRDKEFGPVVMFGLGGIFTEALSDVAFRLAPLEEADAAEMLDELRAGTILGDFRGEKAADRQALIRTLTGLGKIGIEHPEIAEIDVNPLMILPDGQVRAADALVVTGKKPDEKIFLPPVDPVLLGNFFYSRSVAFIGASARMGKWGHTLINAALAGNFGGRIYPVNPGGGEIAGQPVFRTIADIPGEVDMAVVTIPARFIPDLIPQLQKKGVKNMLVISSGFGEIGAEGKELEKQIIEKARAAGILLMGPNTMGMCNPHTRFYCMWAHVWPLPGDTAMVAQSGNLGTQLMAFAEQQGIGIRCFAGTGNESMITVEDFMDAFEIDDKTRNIVLYLESVKNGRRFFETARQVSRKKPVILLKGGRTQAGNRAAASHTGALGSNSRIFQAMCRQAGIVWAEYTTDLMDLAAAFSSLPLPAGNRAAVMTLGGGWGVVTSDQCSESGLVLPELSPDIVKELDQLLPPYWSRSNPVDVVGEGNNDINMKILETLIRWDGCDAVICLGMIGRKNFQDRVIESVMKIEETPDSEALTELKTTFDRQEDQYIAHAVNLMEKYNKPVFGVNLSFSQDARTVYPVDGRRYRGIFYPTPRQAVKAFAKMCQYHKFLKR